jgi:signal transduction histidine kinase
MYRVVEEASNNVLKHAKATKVTVKLDRPGEDLISMTVQDNGQGFDIQATTPGFGILAMQDYCTAMGGTLEVQSQVGKGTIVIASFPFAQKPAGAPHDTAT